MYVVSMLVIHLCLHNVGSKLVICYSRVVEFSENGLGRNCYIGCFECY